MGKKNKRKFTKLDLNTPGKVYNVDPNENEVCGQTAQMEHTESSLYVDKNESFQKAEFSGSDIMLEKDKYHTDVNPYAKNRTRDETSSSQYRKYESTFPRSEERRSINPQMYYKHDSIVNERSKAHESTRKSTKVTEDNSSGSQTSPCGLYKARYSYPGTSKNKSEWSRRDDEYMNFLMREKKKSTVKFEKVMEKEMDLFDIPDEYSLGHCVAEDMRMGSGIAVKFKSVFKDVDELLDQRAKQGGLALLKRETEKGIRFIYYLVTKRVSSGKPTYDTFWSSLQKMRNHIQENNVKKLALPRIGCGLDKLDWPRVKHMIEFLFRDVDVEIIICSLLLNEDVTLPKQDTPKQLKVVQVPSSLTTIENYTIILYLTTQDGYISKLMSKLDAKFNFLAKLKGASKRMGEVVRFESPLHYILYGCVVKNNNKDHFDFKSFKNCLQEVNKYNRKDMYVYVALEPSDYADDKDSDIHEKIITMLKTFLREVDIYVCWDGIVPDKSLGTRE